MAVYELSLAGSPKTFSAVLPNGTYRFRTVYAPAPSGEGGWLLDIADANGVALACGIPLVTGCDLLGQYAYLGIVGKLYVATEGDFAAPPTFGNLGTTSHLYLEA